MAAGGSRFAQGPKPCDAARLFRRFGACKSPFRSSTFLFPPPQAAISCLFVSCAISGLAIKLPCNLFFSRAAHALRCRPQQVFGAFAAQEVIARGEPERNAPAILFFA